MAATTNKDLEAKEVVSRVPNWRSREAPLGLGLEVVDDPEANRLMIANLVSLVEEHASPLEIEHLTNVLAPVRDERVVGGNDNTIVANVLEALLGRILGEVLLVSVLDVAAEFLSPLLEQVVRHNNQIVAEFVARLVRDVVEHVDGLSETHVVSEDATARVAGLLRRHPIHRLLLVVVELNLGRKAHGTRFCV